MSGRARMVPGPPARPAPGGDAGPALRRPVLRRSALDLAPLDTAVPGARRHARHVVGAWGMAGLAADCELVVAELVTNAIQASRGLAGEAAARPVRLRLTGRPLGVRVAVWDRSDDLPAPGRDRAADEPGGWGLVLVAALATRWGTYRTAGGGKCVWAVLGD